MMDIVKIESKVEQYKLMDLVGLQTVLDKIEEVDKDLNVARGLVYMRAKEICFDEGHKWEDFVKQLVVGGKSVGEAQSNRLIMVADMTLASVSFKRTTPQRADTLVVPESIKTVTKLTGGTPMEKVENFNEVNTGFGKEQSSGSEVDYYNKTMTGSDEEKQAKLTKVKLHCKKKTITVKDVERFDAAKDFEDEGEQPYFDKDKSKKEEDKQEAKDRAEYDESVNAELVDEIVELKKKLKKATSKTSDLAWYLKKLESIVSSLNLRLRDYEKELDKKGKRVPLTLISELADAYKVLGFAINDNPNKKQVKEAFSNLSRIHHPDLGGDAEVMKTLNNAYTVLKRMTKKG